ncbi:PIN domain-containing protein [Lactococcus lactis]|uniref:PIN-like domain-containing protein n=1 Tax=Lactococcus lactis TaxID=1358 RepID=UPI002416AC63|nr:PIN-like domain-containing protein [Lactococcus lactis]MDG4972938.1 PIN domain-containing protein [Lactococcus lactis]
MNLYSEYISDDEKKQFFDKGIIIFDTSSLLKLYTYNQETALDILEKCAHLFKGRMFLPDQVRYEFEKNKEKVVEKPIESYKKILGHNEPFHKIKKTIDDLNVIQKNVKGYLQTFIERLGKEDKHPYLSSDFIYKFEEEVNRYLESLESITTNSAIKSLDLSAEVDKQVQTIREQVTLDSLKSIIDQSFIAGREYSFSDLFNIAKEGKIRYDLTIPPGYKDKEEKNGFQVYGDLFVWYQIIEYAKEKKAPCIFVSDDIKEDWNEKEGKKTNSKLIRHELQLEFNEKAKFSILKRTLVDFIYEFGEYFKVKFGEGTLDEIKLNHISELLEGEKEQFIEEVESEILENIENEYTVPDYEFNYEYYDNTKDIISIKIIDVSQNIDQEYSVVYEITIDIGIDYDTWEYWGRDDDTKEEIHSPHENTSYYGEILLTVHRTVTVDENDELVTTESNIFTKSNNFEKL